MKLKPTPKHEIFNNSLAVSIHKTKNIGTENKNNENKVEILIYFTNENIEIFLHIYHMFHKNYNKHGSEMV